VTLTLTLALIPTLTLTLILVLTLALALTLTLTLNKVLTLTLTLTPTPTLTQTLTLTFTLTFTLTLNLDLTLTLTLRIFAETKPSRVSLWKSTTSESSAGRRDWRAANYNGNPGRPPCPNLYVEGICTNLAVLFRDEDVSETEAGSQEYEL
jgi:hypothetical protein